MGDSPVKDFFDLDMKDKMKIIESRKKLEKDLIHHCNASQLLPCRSIKRAHRQPGLNLFQVSFGFR